MENTELEIYITFVQSLLGTMNISAGLQGLKIFCGIDEVEAQEVFKTYKALELKDAQDLQSDTSVQRMDIIHGLAMKALEHHNISQNQVR